MSKLKAQEKKKKGKNDILTIEEVSSYLRLNIKTTYKLAKEGRIPGFKIAGTWRFRAGDIHEYIMNQIRLHRAGFYED